MATINSTTGQTGSETLYDGMLRRWAPMSLLEAEVVKRNWLLNSIKKNNDWKGGALEVPFQSSHASSVALGKLPSSTDIASFGYKVNTISGYKEVWGTMVFYHKDLVQHNASMKGTPQSQQSFLSALIREIPKFTSQMSQKISIAILNGGAMAKATETPGTGSNGNSTIVIDRVDRVQIGEKVVVKSSLAAVADQTVYIDKININTKVISVKDSRANIGTANGDVNLSSFLVGGGSNSDSTLELFYDGAENSANQLVSLRNQLLSADNGGNDMWFGEAKANQPFSQAVEIDGSGWTRGTSLAAPGDFLYQLFQADAKARELGYAMPKMWVMSYQNSVQIKSALEAQKGSYKMLDTNVKTLDQARSFTWKEMLVGSVVDSEPLMIITVQEMPDDVIYGLDMSTLKLFTNGFIRRHMDPNGNTFFTLRDSANGFRYLLDYYMFGEFVVCEPCKNVAIYDLPAVA